MSSGVEVLGDGGGGKATQSRKPGRVSGQQVMDQKVKEERDHSAGWGCSSVRLGNG